MMQITTLLLFPDEILTTILVEWSESTQIVHLDTACCCSHVRDSFLRLLNHQFLTIESEDKVLTRSCCAFYFMNWVYLRGIKLSKLIVVPISMIGNILCFNIDLSSVENLEISGTFGDTVSFLDLINNCTNLHSLELAEFNSITTNFMFEKLEHLQRFTSISVCDESNNITPAIWNILATKCTDLEIIKFRFDTNEDLSLNVESYKDFLISMLQSNPKIMDINLTVLDDENADLNGVVSVDLLEILAQYCPNGVRFCFIRCFGSINISHVLQILQLCIQMVELDITKHDGDLDCLISYHRILDVKRIQLEGFFDTEHDFKNSILHIKYIFESIFGFTHVELLRILDLRDSFLRCLAQNNMLTLVHLTVGSCGVDYTCAAICDVINRCKHLTSLHLLDCKHFSDNNYIELCLSTDRLQDLTFNYAFNLSTTTLIMLIDHWKCLSKLSIYRCMDVDKSILEKYCSTFRPDIFLCYEIIDRYRFYCW
jgi:hypothetical protein